MKYLNMLIICLTFSLFSCIAFADTTMSRDGDGQKIQGPAYGVINSVAVGGGGYHCFATTSKIAWEVKVVASTTTDGANLPFKMFYNGDESNVYPVTDKFYQWQNSPTSKTPTISSVCLRPYSSATLKTAVGVFQ